MKKIKFQFIIMCILNYSLVLFGAVCFKMGAMFLYPSMLVMQIVLLIVNCVFSESSKQIIILSIHMLLSTVLAHIVSTSLYMTFISGDFETMLIGIYAALIGSIIVIVLSSVAILVKSFWIKAKKQAISTNK